jgi:hypothetical protein
MPGFFFVCALGSAVSTFVRPRAQLVGEAAHAEPVDQEGLRPGVQGVRLPVRPGPPEEGLGLDAAARRPAGAQGGGAPQKEEAAPKAAAADGLHRRSAGGGLRRRRRPPDEVQGRLRLLHLLVGVAAQRRLAPRRRRQEAQQGAARSASKVSAALFLCLTKTFLLHQMQNFTAPKYFSCMQYFSKLKWIFEILILSKAQEF